MSTPDQGRCERANPAQSHNPGGLAERLAGKPTAHRRLHAGRRTPPAQLPKILEVIDDDGMTGMITAPSCAKCGAPSARVELVAPGELPADWEQWSKAQRDAFRRYRDPAQWWLLFEGVAAGNGGGDQVTAERAARLLNLGAERGH